ncbi:MAG: hypothetical protein HRU19_01445 [Pseudobacteriovorax sp.]|nr:hypothetical protein [Pseudobacteriovorax sp.]
MKHLQKYYRAKILCLTASLFPITSLAQPIDHQNLGMRDHIGMGAHIGISQNLRIRSSVDNPYLGRGLGQQGVTNPTNGSLFAHCVSYEGVHPTGHTSDRRIIKFNHELSQTRALGRVSAGMSLSGEGSVNIKNVPIEAELSGEGELEGKFKHESHKEKIGFTLIAEVGGRKIVTDGNYRIHPEVLENIDNVSSNSKAIAWRNLCGEAFVTGYHLGAYLEVSMSLSMEDHLLEAELRGKISDAVGAGVGSFSDMIGDIGISADREGEAKASYTYEGEKVYFYKTVTRIGGVVFPGEDQDERNPNHETLDKRVTDWINKTLDNQETMEPLEFEYSRYETALNSSELYNRDLIDLDFMSEANVYMGSLLTKLRYHWSTYTILSQLELESDFSDYETRYIGEPDHAKTATAKRRFLRLLRAINCLSSGSYIDHPSQCLQQATDAGDEDPLDVLDIPFDYDFGQFPKRKLKHTIQDTKVNFSDIMAREGFHTILFEGIDGVCRMTEHNRKFALESVTDPRGNLCRFRLFNSASVRPGYKVELNFDPLNSDTVIGSSAELGKLFDLDQRASISPFQPHALAFLQDVKVTGTFGYHWNHNMQRVELIGPDNIRGLIRYLFRD